MVGNTTKPSFLDPEEYYTILEITPEATYTEIRRAYLAQSLKYHPDKNNNSEESTVMFKKISNAYQILSNPDEREKYDRERISPFYGENLFNGTGHTNNNRGTQSSRQNRDRGFRPPMEVFMSAMEEIFRNKNIEQQQITTYENTAAMGFLSAGLGILTGLMQGKSVGAAVRTGLMYGLAGGTAGYIADMNGGSFVTAFERLTEEEKASLGFFWNLVQLSPGIPIGISRSF